MQEFVTKAINRSKQFCLSETIPDDADLVLVELDINHHDTSRESLDATEALLRTMLSLPNKPAVIYMSVFALFLLVDVRQMSLSALTMGTLQAMKWVMAGGTLRCSPSGSISQKSISGTS